MDKKDKNPIKQIEDKLKITPRKAMSPKQLQKKLESEKKRLLRQQEKEEREKKKQEEKERVRLEKEKQKLEKEQLKQKERDLKDELKRKEKEEKEAKRKEKEEREEQKRKERELEKLKKQQEIDEKNKEKLKQEEQKQKAAAAFVNFFKSEDNKKLDVRKVVKTSLFKPFEIKTDMRLPPLRRPNLTEEEKERLLVSLLEQKEEKSYLDELKSNKTVGKSSKTWPFEDCSDDVVLLDEEVGVTIEDQPKGKKMRAKLLKFRENRRPPYFGTWRKTSRSITGRTPFKMDEKFFNYEEDSDDDWEEEEQGESLNGSDDEEKENDVEDYEVDNDFFVPHGHLSDDEIDDESGARLSPESLKQKLKLLKDEFDQDMQTKTHKIKPRSIGCVWYNKDGDNVDEAIDKHLRPLAILTNGNVVLKKRSELVQQTPTRKHSKEMKEELIVPFLKMIHGNTKNRKFIVGEFVACMENNGIVVDVSKTYLGKWLQRYAQWKKCTEDGAMLNKFCWWVEDDVKNKYNVDLVFK